MCDCRENFLNWICADEHDEEDGCDGCAEIKFFDEEGEEEGYVCGNCGENPHEFVLIRDGNVFGCEYCHEVFGSYEYGEFLSRKYENMASYVWR